MCYRRTVYYNSISINLHAPSIHVFPEVLPIQGGPFSIYSPQLGQLLVSSCLPYSNLTCDGVSVSYSSNSSNVNRISAEISNYSSSLSEYSCNLQLTPSLVTHFEIIIATITSSTDSGVCFVGTTCQTRVFVSDPTIDLSTLSPQGIRADIVDYTTEFNSTLLTFTPTAIEPIIYLCKYDICFPVSELPPVVQLLDISSSHFVYFGVESVFSLDLQANNLGRYHVDWSDYIFISDFQIRFDVLDEGHLRLHLSAVGIGEHSINTFSGISMSTTELKIEIIDALVFPTIFVSSKSVFFSDSMDVVTIFLNDLQFNLYLGYNELDLFDLNNCPPSVIVSADQNYREIELLCQDFSFSDNYSQLLNGLYSFVQLHVPINEGWSYDVSCVKNSECEISEVFIELYLSIVVRFSVSGIGHVLLSITEDRHVSELLVPLEVIAFPVFHLNPLNLSVVYYNVATFSVFIKNYVKSGSFFINDQILNFVVHDLTDKVLVTCFLPDTFTTGFTMVNLIWRFSSFSPFFIESISVFKLSITTITEFVSISSPRDLSVVVDTMTDQFNFFCKIDDGIFPIEIVSSTEIICIDVFTSIISPSANVSIASHNSKLIDSYLASVEGLFFSRVLRDSIRSCSSTVIPIFLIDSHEGDWSNASNGFRCCQGSILQCSVSVKHYSNITISFSQQFHFITFSITSRAGCKASTRRDPPIEILNFDDVTWECSPSLMVLNLLLDVYSRLIPSLFLMLFL
ncbi:hypothetical protein GEMRC1_001606 [Eukaryota sp. GEM-RC1]